MMSRLWSVLQGLTEYVGVTGGQGGAGSGGQAITAWAVDNRMALLAGAALLLLLGLMNASRRR